MENCITETGTGSAATNSVRLADEEFHKLPFDDKRIYLDGVLPKEKLDLILGDPDDKKLTRAMQPQELYWQIGRAHV